VVSLRLHISISFSDQITSSEIRLGGTNRVVHIGRPCEAMLQTALRFWLCELARILRTAIGRNGAIGQLSRLRIAIQFGQDLIKIV
jgi:hypothetical protein